MLAPQCQHRERRQHARSRGPPDRTSRPESPAIARMPDQRGCNGKPLRQPSQPPHEYGPGIWPKDATDKEARTPRSRGRSVVVLYNEERPHESLGQRPPASVYQPSPRAMPTRLAEPDYPAEAAIRQVRSNGEIKWQGDLIHVCSALVGEAVAIEETETGQWQVRFFDMPIGVIDVDNRKLRRPAVPQHGLAQAGGVQIATADGAA